MNIRVFSLRPVLLYLFLFKIMAGYTQNETKSIVSGYIKDAKTGESLFAATVFSETKRIGTISNDYGFFSLELPNENHQLTIQYIGFQDTTFQIELRQDATLTIELQPTAFAIKEVVVSSKEETQNTAAISMTIQKITPQKVKELPMTLGEPDIIKTVQLLTPGVQTSGEGNNGLVVRGGASDQNLILLDEAIVYNPNHLLGFFSTFNTNTVRDLTFYKGGIPAKYGGRLSSVMNVQMKEGNNKQFLGSGSLGLLASNLTLEGPIQKNKSSFIVSGRRSYFDILFSHANADEATDDNQVYFYDVNAKVNFKINDKNRIYISGYFGRDNFVFGSDFGLKWSNKTGTFRWNRIHSNKLFSNTSIIFSKFDYGITLGTGDNQADFTASIQDISLKQDFNWYLNAKNSLSFGGQLTRHDFEQGKVTSSNSSTYTDFELPNKMALEGNFYISNKHQISQKLGLEYGVRATVFALMGATDEYVFADPNDAHPTDTLTYGSHEFYKTYVTLEPRFLLRYSIDEVSSIKLAYDRNSQNIHVASNTMVSFPTDLQLPSSSILKPEIADQFSLGYFRNFRDNEIETSIELYYKRLQNVIDFRSGADLFANPFIEREIVVGTGESYGLEIFGQKTEGKTTGFLSYSLSWSKRQFNEINDGNSFFANNDRRNVLNLGITYKINPKWLVSATWSYADGNAVSLPTGRLFLDGNVVATYTERNGGRMAANHHLDLSATFTGKQTKKIKSNWNFSIYNVYAQKNPWIYSFRPSENVGQMEAVKLYLYSIVPSVVWNFKF